MCKLSHLSKGAWLESGAIISNLDCVAWVQVPNHHVNTFPWLWDSDFELRPELSKRVSHVIIWMKEDCFRGKKGCKNPDQKYAWHVQEIPKLWDVAETELSRKLRGNYSHIIRTLWSTERRIDGSCLSVEAESVTPSMWQVMLA